jgi:hypothetical protein
VNRRSELSRSGISLVSISLTGTFVFRIGAS